MGAYRQGATGDTVLAKTKEMKKYHQVPLRIDPQPRIGYDRNHGRQALENIKVNDTDRDALRSPEVNNDNGGDDGGDYDADDRPDDVGAGEGVGEAEDGGGEDDGHHSDMDLGLLAESEFESEGEGYGAEGGDDGSTAAAQSI